MNELVPVTYSTNPEIIEHFPKKAPDTKCNGKVHRQPRYCQRPAGWGTDHPGTGRCKLHGGCSTGSKSGQLRYSDFVPTSVVEKYEEFAVEPDIDIKSLNHEIALIRAKITDLEATNINHMHDRSIGNFTELVRRLVETKQKVEEGIKSKVTIEVVVKLVDAVVEIIERKVQDVEVKKQIATEMRRLNFTDLSLN